MRGPSSVTATVCSQCAARDPSVVTTVHSSARIRVLVVPSVSIGSIASTDPTISAQLRIGFQPRGLVPGYINDPVCDGYGVVLVLPAELEVSFPP